MTNLSRRSGRLSSSWSLDRADLTSDSRLEVKLTLISLKSVSLSYLESSFSWEWTEVEFSSLVPWKARSWLVRQRWVGSFGADTSKNESEEIWLRPQRPVTSGKTGSRKRVVLHQKFTQLTLLNDKTIEMRSSTLKGPKPCTYCRSVELLKFSYPIRSSDKIGTQVGKVHLRALVAGRK